MRPAPTPRTATDFLVLGMIALVACLCAVGLWQRFFTPSNSTTATHEVTAKFVQRTVEAITAFHADLGRYPTQKEGLQVLCDPPDTGESDRWHGPYLETEAMPADVWSRAFIYQIPASRSGQDYDLYSLGPDGIMSSDDIGNWK